MSKTDKYRQCILIKKIETGELKTTSFIPEKYAKIGWILSLKNDKCRVNGGDEWSEGWEVITSGELVDGRFVENQAHNSTDIWKATSGNHPRGNK